MSSHSDCPATWIIQPSCVWPLGLSDPRVSGHSDYPTLVCPATWIIQPSCVRPLGLSDPHVSDHLDYPTLVCPAVVLAGYPPHWHSIIQNSIVVYMLQSAFLRSNIGFLLQLTFESFTTRMHELLVIPYACTFSCSSVSSNSVHV